ncbi:hypothetical protein Fleli_2421 [Bernardetia litoralis DSM 6794]|uniref:DUF4271 domain-containing protein n=1 Tax=Bernardetia litoralis (strain ATCC 23117 / DSM 6794 / NBRC 15988 / NCIMB 1366 / Fx l1 / Sio-4) TaxID=880071 RepID=I4ALF3_BERLS|nr:DUF4271 domain-containing protein [Bernardetia litoralis]AFM04788.1 hypothetical protein Fleli_2421 [Bernardetia litoralis DSM 6794]
MALSTLPVVESSSIYQTLSENWVVYDEDLESYVPYLPTVHSQYRALHLIFDFNKNLNDYKNHYLGIALPQNAKLFWNTRFSSIVSKNEYIEISYDSLINLYSDKGSYNYRDFNGFLMLTVYQEKPQNQIIEPYSAYILTQKNSFTKEKIVQKTVINPTTAQKPKSPLPDWILMINWFMVGIIVTFSISIYPIIGTEAFGESWDYFFRPAKTFKRTELLPQIGYIVYFSLVMGFVWIFYNYIELYGTTTNSYFIIKNSLFSFVLSWLYASFWCLCIAAFRLFWIQLMGKLFFKSSQVSEQHTQALILGNTFVMSLIFITTVLFSFLVDSFYVPTLESSDSSFLSYFVVLVAFSILTHSLLVSYYLFTRTNVSKLYLFSYLCATEIIPLLIVSKWIISVS